MACLSPELPSQAAQRAGPTRWTCCGKARARRCSWEWGGPQWQPWPRSASNHGALSLSSSIFPSSVFIDSCWVQLSRDNCWYPKKKLSHLVLAKVLLFHSLIYSLLIYENVQIEICSFGSGFIIALPAGFETGTVNTLVCASQVKMRSPPSFYHSAMSGFLMQGLITPKLPGTYWNRSGAITGKKRI